MKNSAVLKCLKMIDLSSVWKHFQRKVVNGTSLTGHIKISINLNKKYRSLMQFGLSTDLTADGKARIKAKQLHKLEMSLFVFLITVQL